MAILLHMYGNNLKQIRYKVLTYLKRTARTVQWRSEGNKVLHEQFNNNKYVITITLCSHCDKTRISQKKYHVNFTQRVRFVRINVMM